MPSRTMRAASPMAWAPVVQALDTARLGPVKPTMAASCRGRPLVQRIARFLLLKNSIVTGVLGLVFLGTTLFGTPLTLAASQSFQPARKAELRHEYDTDPHVRRGHRLSSTVWGVGLVLEALVRVPLVFLLPIDVIARWAR